MKKMLPFLGMILFLAAVAAFVQAVRVNSGPTPVGEPWTPPERVAVVNRCSDRGFDRILWSGADPEERSSWSLVEQYAESSVPTGRHAGQPGISVGDLLPDATGVVLVPCVGEPLRFERAELDAGRGIWLVPNQRGAMKVFDFRDEGRGELLTRALFAIEPVAD